MVANIFTSFGVLNQLSEEMRGAFILSSLPGQGINSVALSYFCPVLSFHYCVILFPRVHFLIVFKVEITDRYFLSLVCVK